MRILGNLIRKKKIRVRQVAVRALYDTPKFIGRTYAISDDGRTMYRKAKKDSFFVEHATCGEGSEFNPPRYGCIAFGYRFLPSYINDDGIIFVMEEVK